MKEVTLITLDDGKEYAVIDELILRNTKYLYLVNSIDQDDFIIQKLVDINSYDEIIGLDDDSEYDLALVAFANKNVKNN